MQRGKLIPKKFGFLLMFVILTGCSPTPDLANAPVPAPTAVPVEVTRVPDMPLSTPTLAPSATSVPTLIPTATSTATSVPLSPQAILEASHAAMSAVGSFQFEMQLQMRRGAVMIEGEEFPYTFTGDYLLPNSFKAAWELTRSTRTVTGELIRIGDREYSLNQETAEWEEVTRSVAPVGPELFITLEPAKLEALQLVEQTNRAERAVYHLQAGLNADTSGLEKAEELVLDLWIGAEDFLLYEGALSGGLLAQHETIITAGSRGFVDFEMVLSCSDFGKEVTITPPENPVALPLPDALLFADDFSDPASGWDRVQLADGMKDYEAGVYRIFIDDSYYDLLATPGLNFTDVSIEVIATKVGGADDNDFGIICRYQDPANFHYFWISSDGYFTIGTMVDGVFEARLDWVRTYSIRQGDASNVIRANCIGDELTLDINGLRNGKSDGTATLPSGDVGLIAGTWEEPGTVILFDDFWVYAP